ncbi:MAG: CarD family transcriptional regulator [Sumerlaeia bacterium]
MMKFQRGETVVEPSIGICQVGGLTMKHVDGKDRVLYIFNTGNAQILVPEDQVEKRGIRPPMSRDDVKRVLAALKQPASPNRSDARLQYINYREIMKSGDPGKITRLLRDLYILDQSDDLKGKEKEIMEQAKKFLIEEISYVREISKGNAQETIIEALKQMYKKKQAKDKEKAKKSGANVPMSILGYDEDEEGPLEGADTASDTQESKEKSKASASEYDEDEFEEDEDEEEKPKAKSDDDDGDDDDDSEEAEVFDEDEDDEE